MDFRIAEVLSMLAHSGKSGRLEVSGGAWEGRVWLESGRITAADSLGDSEVDVAVFNLTRLEGDGSFSFDVEGPENPSSEAGRSVEEVLEKAEELGHIWREVVAVLPSRQIGLDLSEELSEDEVHLSSAEWRIISAVSSTGWFGGVAERMHQGEFSLSLAVKKLIDRGMIVVNYDRAVPIAPAPADVVPRASSLQRREDDLAEPRTGSSSGHSETEESNDRASELVSVSSATTVAGSRTREPWVRSDRSGVHEPAQDLSAPEMSVAREAERSPISSGPGKGVWSLPVAPRSASSQRPPAPLVDPSTVDDDLRAAVVLHKKDAEAQADLFVEPASAADANEAVELLLRRHGDTGSTLDRADERDVEEPEGEMEPALGEDSSEAEEESRDGEASRSGRPSGGGRMADRNALMRELRDL